jgi:serine/threonine protein kinase
MADQIPYLPTTATLNPLPEASDALPVGSMLGDFEIRQVIGVGGFGTVYRAWEGPLERDVAIKEYMPMGMVGRNADGHLTLRSKLHQEDFDLGLRSFLNEAKLLARFDQPSLVKVYRFWEENGTAYMVMPFYRAQTLRQLRQESGSVAVTEPWLTSMLDPLLAALAEMHRAEVYHRDIAPDNILWCVDNRPVLLDFGAARRVLADRTQHLTAVLKPQFAPIEQYADAHSMRQGPWTDLFALASTCYFMLTGRPPLPATARILSDDLPSLCELQPPGFSTRVLATLDWAMAIHPADRLQSVAAFRDALHGHAKVPDRVAPFRLPRTPPPADGSSYEPTVQTSVPFEPESITASVRYRETLSPGSLQWPGPPAEQADVDALPARTRFKSAPVLLGAAAVVGAVLVGLSSHRSADQGVGNPAASSAMASGAGTGLPALAKDSARQGETAAVVAREASASAAVPAVKAASTPVSPVGPRETCIANKDGNVEACVKRLCKADARFKRSSTCVKLQRQAEPWWKFFKGG